MFARMTEQNASKMEALKGYMRTTTVDPQQMFGGTVMFDLPKAARGSRTDIAMTFVVTINGEEHEFDAVLKRR
jgi:acyl-CoA hydrolase